MLGDHEFKDEPPHPDVEEWRAFGGACLLALGYVLALAVIGWFLVLGKR